MNKVRLGIVGAGHLGRIHARLAAQVPGVELVAVSDPSDASLNSLDPGLQVQKARSHREILDKIDAAVIASPTYLHAEIAQDLLRAGKHVFVEKPVTDCPADAEHLVQVAKEQGLVVQVGHVERFNPAWRPAVEHVGEAKYIEAVRASSFPGRCLDGGVVMDLMIHDIDLVLSLARGTIIRVDASGLAVVTEHEDIAEARLTFSCGLVANLKASRVSPAAVRQMQVFGDSGWATIDFGTPSVAVMQPHRSVADRSFRLASAGPLDQFRNELFSRWLPTETLPLEPCNAILEELKEFCAAVAQGQTPRVDGSAGARAVDVAARVLGAIDSRAWYGASGRPVHSGPYAIPRRTIRRLPALLEESRRAA